jgi:hypothetical protein
MVPVAPSMKTRRGRGERGLGFGHGPGADDAVSPASGQHHLLQRLGQRVELGRHRRALGQQQRQHRGVVAFGVHRVAGRVQAAAEHVAAEAVGLVPARAMVQQHLHHRRVAAEGGLVQRAGIPVAARGHRPAQREHQPHRLGMAALRLIGQQAQAIGVELGHGARMPRKVGARGGFVGRGTGREESFRRAGTEARAAGIEQGQRRAIARTGRVPGGAVAVVVAHGRVGAAFEQQLHEVHRAPAQQRMVQRRPAAGAAFIGVGTEVQHLAQVGQVVLVELAQQCVGARPACASRDQRLEHAAIALLGGVVERLVVVRFGASLQQHLDGVEATRPRDGAVEQRQCRIGVGRVAQRGVGIGALVEQPAQRGQQARPHVVQPCERREGHVHDRGRGEGADRRVQVGASESPLHRGEVTANQRQRQAVQRP